jgi:hypothetical protein
MTLVAFSKASDTASPDDLRVNALAVLYVEASRPDLLGHTMIHLLGQGTTVNAVTEPLDKVVSALAGVHAHLVAATRHYMALPPDQSPNTVYISPAHISYARPNLPSAPDFWVLRFVDGSELRVAHPLPEGL